MIEVIYPCQSCTDDECGEQHCPQYETATGIYHGAARLALVVAESGLAEEKRLSMAFSLADGLDEAFGHCATRMDRASYLEACNLPPTATR